MMNRLFLILILLSLFKFGFTQQVFVFYDRYSEDTVNELKKNGFSNMTIITRGNIDPKRINEVNDAKVSEFLNKNFTRNNEFYLVIDWEEQGYRDLRNLQKGNPKFDFAEKQYLKLISIIRAYNSRIKVGIYGLPSRLPVNKKANINQKKFDNLLSNVDFICPSFYTMNPVIEIGSKLNTEYFNENLKQAISYGKRLNKPVLPFVWELVHADNKSFGQTLLTDDEFLSNIRQIQNYNFQGSKVSGIIWWAPGKISQAYDQDEQLKRLNKINSAREDPRSIYMKKRATNVKSVFLK